jgi:hypothetical protein
LAVFKPSELRKFATVLKEHYEWDWDALNKQTQCMKEQAKANMSESFSDRMNNLSSLELLSLMDYLETSN